MANDDAKPAGGANKLVIRNIGLLLSGDLRQPILDANIVVAVDGKITAVGKRGGGGVAGAPTTVGAERTKPAAGLIDSHGHPGAGGWGPRQNQLRWIGRYLHAG